MTTENALIPTWWEQKSFKDFKKIYQASKSPLFFIGSGISRWAGLPNWRDLLIGLAQYYENKTEAPRINLVEETIKRLANLSDDSSVYQKTGSFIRQQFINEQTWRQALKSLLKVDTPSDIHDVIAHLSWHRIITPNYDPLIELAARRINKEVLVVHPWNTEGIEQIERSDIPSCIFKIHGDIGDDSSQIILTEEDYKGLYSAPEDDNNPNVFKRTLGTLLRSTTVTLFMGYSHDDPYLRTLYNYSKIGAKKDNVFALVERSGKDFEKRINDLTKELNIEFISYSGNDNHDHNELLDFLKYFIEPEAADEHYRQLAKLKKPTVIMLHCGGTISSEPKDPVESPLSVVKKNSRYDGELKDFSTKLLNSYKDSYNSGNEVDIDIIWEILPVEFQMFSENATPMLWNEMRKKIESIIFKYFHAPEISQEACISQNKELQELYDEENRQYSITFGDQEELPYKRFLSEFKNKYILGVVILFGTDTLAYMAPALSFSLQHLPCPIIITGANQSPVETELEKRNLLYASSDAWKNLRLSVYFLQCFGHRMREIFVCFGNTIHNCVNLRKRSAEIIPSGRLLLSNPLFEPFTYRNISPQYQYMFRFIDGIFCNNYYTNNYLALRNPHVRHIRLDALKPTPQEKLIGNDFHSVVQHVTVTPNFPLINVIGMLSNGEGRNKLRAFLVEGYPSGTYPTSRDNNFTRLLEELYHNGIPVIIVSRYGILATQQKYDTIPLPDGTTVPVLYLFGVIAETALPLMSMGISQISVADWDIEDTPANTLIHRIKLIKKHLTKFFKNRPDIISEELKHITQRNDMYSHQKKHQDEMIEADTKTKYTFGTRGMGRKHFPALPNKKYAENEALRADKEDVVTVSRHDFKLLLSAFVKTFENVGAGPDGFEVIYNVGFEIGIPLFKSFSDLNRPFSDRKVRTENYTAYADRSVEVRQEMEKNISLQLELVSTLLSSAGIGDISVSELTISPPNAPDKQASAPSPENSFKFKIFVNRHGERERKDIKYAVMTYSDSEADFFRKLMHPDKHDHDSFISKLDDDYKKLIRSTWQNYVQGIDWLILGIYKSVACGIAENLRFDQIAIESMRNIVVSNALRQAVKVEVLVGDENGMVAEFSYFEKNSNNTDS
jgi:L-asparaginase/Glu-tRNA(Gln) amidotransferase subunit D